MWGLLAKVGLGLVVTIAVVSYAWKQAEKKEPAPDADGTSPPPPALTCDTATKMLPKDMQDLIAVTVASGKPKLIADLAAEIDNGVNNGVIKPDVGKKLAECLKGAGSAPLADGSAVTGKAADLGKAYSAMTGSPSPTIFFKAGDKPWPAIQELPEESVSLGSKYNWRPTILGLLAGIDYNQFMAGALVNTGKRAFPTHYQVSEYIALMEKDPVLQAAYSGLGGALPMSVATLNAVYDKLNANGY